ncbi:Lrp/AsnC family transcriptional regulator [Pseudovibrio sp. WM33]|uniref:Lrp/AsnC family transcriptional regulator n=1 Tax=Pseudovibrio sp. WM33 TaxID=1735585 RepID=UPI0007AE70F6|nr:Lrp/AsnC family transcriptional regulator [Pseudovibrio sp. WM33]KZL27899.1 Leucine-responsive regulatory protein [Pseudovibrio sp. WM33]
MSLESSGQQKKAVQLDAADRKILQVLQTEGRLSNTELAEKVGMSTSPCWRRVRRLEQEGVISNYAARLDRKTLGLGVFVVVMIQIDAHNAEQAVEFEKAVLKLEQVIACYSVGGGVDFVLQVVCEDLDAYAEFSMNTLRRLPGIKAMESNFVLKELKPLTGWPV